MESVADVGRAADLVILAVFNTDQVESVIEGDAGLLSVSPAAGRSRVIINLEHLRAGSHQGAE